MIFMSDRTFVDTNVFVYWLDSGHPAKRAIAEEWIGRLWRQQNGRTSMQVLNELYVTLTRKLKNQLNESEAWDVVSALFAWDPLPPGRDVLMRAREIQTRYGISWWDSLIVAAAQAQDCAALLSEDLQHGMNFGGVTVQNPFEPIVQEPHARYRPEPLEPRHRPRGRPRKNPTAMMRRTARPRS
jgi:predicted nucleic acid-binding protein